MTCRICLEEEGIMIQPCNCKGTAANVHEECLLRWLSVSNKTTCEICNFEYVFEEKVERVGSRCNPKCAFADDTSTQRLVIVFGILLCLITEMEGVAFPDMLSAAYISTNLVIFMFVVLSYCFCIDLHVFESLTYWKWCTFMGFLCLTFISGDSFFTRIEAATASALTLGLYFYLLHKNRTRVIQELILDDSQYMYA